MVKITAIAKKGMASNAVTLKKLNINEIQEIIIINQNNLIE